MRIFRKQSHLPDSQFGLVLLIPAIFVIGFVIVFPLLQAVGYSFTDKTVLWPQIHWKGLDNYKRLFSDVVFWEVFYNTVVICFASMTIQLILGLFLALLLNQPIKGRNLLRGMFLNIWVIPFIVVALLWMWLFNAEYGLINYLLREFRLIKKFVPWFALEGGAKVAIVVTYAWRGTPFSMIMLLAGLQTIPEEIMDAAKMDGAGPLARFIHVILPHLRQVIVIISLLSVIQLFQNLIVPFVLTRGGPIYSTTTFSLHVYKTAFTSFRMGEAAAIGCIWLIFLFLFSVFYLAVFLRKGTKFL